jgi:solute carrier family 66, member 2
VLESFQEVIELKMDWIISDELGLTVGHLVGWSAAGAMIIGGVAPYIPQYKQIKKTQDSEGFSLYVCLTLLIANTLRILFWYVFIISNG